MMNSILLLPNEILILIFKIYPNVNLRLVCHKFKNIFDFKIGWTCVFNKELPDYPLYKNMIFKNTIEYNKTKNIKNVIIDINDFNKIECIESVYLMIDFYKDSVCEIYLEHENIKETEFKCFRTCSETEECEYYNNCNNLRVLHIGFPLEYRIINVENVDNLEYIIVSFYKSCMVLPKRFEKYYTKNTYSLSSSTLSKLKDRAISKDMLESVNDYLSK